MSHRSAKGAVFERDISVRLSLWLSDNTNPDWCWRTSMSGGRNTVHAKKREGVRSKIGCGDIQALDPGASPFFDVFTVECKFVASLEWDRTFNTGKSLLIDFWTQAVEQCVGTEPLLMCRPNRRAEMCFTTLKGYRWLKEASYGKLVREVVIPPVGMHGFHLNELFKIKWPLVLAAWKKWNRENPKEV